MRRRQVWAARDGAQVIRIPAEGIPPTMLALPPQVVVPVQTEMRPSDIMMLSEADDGPPPCPKCGKPLKQRGRHFHIRKCNG